MRPSIRNSNLLPVKAMGEVRFRSVLSWRMAGRASTPISSVRLPVLWKSVSLMMESTTAESSSPRKMESTGGRCLLGAQPVVVAGEGHRARRNS